MDGADEVDMARGEVGDKSGVLLLYRMRMLCAMHGLLIAVLARANRVVRKQCVVPRRAVRCVPNARSAQFAKTRQNSRKHVCVTTS